MNVYLFKVIATEGRTNELRRESNLRSEAARARSEGRREGTVAPASRACSAHGGVTSGQLSPVGRREFEMNGD